MMEPKHTADELRQWQALPLSVKVLMTQERIRQWVRYFGEDGVAVSFSGGKDSTVLLDIVRKMYPDVKAVFSNTGLEYPEIQLFVREHENVDVIAPDMRFPDVLTQFGYPLIGKEVAEAIYYARKLRGGKSKGRSEPNFMAEEAKTQRKKEHTHPDKHSGEPQNSPHGQNGGEKLVRLQTGDEAQTRTQRIPNRGSKYEDYSRRCLSPNRQDPTDRDVFWKKPRNLEWEDWRRWCL